MNCSEVQELLSAYFDNELEHPTQEIVSSHLNDCLQCSNELNGFESLSVLASGLKTHSVPLDLWDSIASEPEKKSLAPISTKTVSGVSSAQSHRRQFVLAASGLAIVLLIVLSLNWLFDHGHDHEEMAEAMEQIARNLNDNDSESVLMTKFGGQIVSAEEALDEVGFFPVSTRGRLPDGYQVKNIQVLSMPCCKCTQTICVRKDGTRFYVFEHEEEETGWFDELEKESLNCSGKECEVVRIAGQLAVTWNNGGQFVTLVGITDEAEIEIFVANFAST